MSRDARLLLCALLLAGTAAAHDSRPIYLQIDQHHDGQVLLAWKVPDSVQPGQAPLIRLVGRCAARQGAATGQVPVLEGVRWYDCAAGAAPDAVTLTFPGPAPSLATLVRMQWPDGSSITLRGAPGATTIELESQATTGTVFRQYLTLGVEHILLGFDHLLFVGCLVMLTGSLRRLAFAITGFTIAHSATLGGAALGLLWLPVAPVEAAIALSIVFLATELVRDRRDTLTWRHPLLVASAFGLLHGFGFAAVLNDIGLPERELPMALLSFNLGVEAGQLLFVLVLLPALFALARLLPAPHLTRMAAYPIGTLAAFWMLQRLSGFA
ncbi:MAG: HupE/UreJ family protein [Pseudomonadales bacterium]